MNLNTLMKKHTGKMSVKRSSKSSSPKKTTKRSSIDLGSLMVRHSLSSQQKHHKGQGKKKTSTSSSVWTGKGSAPQGRAKHHGAWGTWVTFGRGTDTERTVFRREAASSQPKDKKRSEFYKRVMAVLKEEEGLSHREALGETSKLWYVKQKAEAADKTLNKASKVAFKGRVIPLLREIGFSSKKAKKQAKVLWDAKSSSKKPRMVIDASLSRRRPKAVIDASKRTTHRATLDQIISRYAG